MMGRAVLALCLVVGVANACPDEFASPEAERAAIAQRERELDQRMERTHQLGANVPDGVAGGSIALMLMGLCALAFTVTRANAVRRTFATSRHMDESQVDVMRRIAQTQSARAAAFVAVCTIALLGIVTLQIELEARVVLAVTPMMLLAIGLLALYRLERLQALGGDGLRVTTHGHYMFVARGKRLVGWVAAPPSLLAQATALPIAKLQR